MNHRYVHSFFSNVSKAVNWFFLPLIKVLKNTVLLIKIMLKTTPSRYFLILRGVLEVHFFDLSTLYALKLMFWKRIIFRGFLKSFLAKNPKNSRDQIYFFGFFMSWDIPGTNPDGFLGVPFHDPWRSILRPVYTRTDIQK